MATCFTRRTAIAVISGCLLALFAHLGFAREPDSGGRPVVRFGLATDLHVGKAVNGEKKLRQYVEAMKQWKPDFLANLGDFACPSVYGKPRKYPEAHDDQLARLRASWAALCEVPCPSYIAMGNHCVGWIDGGQERIRPEDLQKGRHHGEDITKDEFLTVTKMPGRYFSFDRCGYHFIVLDAHNAIEAELKPEEAAKISDRNGFRGEYYIDAAQLAWLEKDLTNNHDKDKIVFLHEEIFCTPKLESRSRGDAPPASFKRPSSDILNGRQVRELFQKDGRVLACFQGHKHATGWIVYEGVCYITLGEFGSVLARTGDDATYSKVTISDAIDIEGVGKQKSFHIPIEKILLQTK
jgi:3',5'-cyclic-AMP phosphodiesterase